MKCKKCGLTFIKGYPTFNDEETRITLVTTCETTRTTPITGIQHDFGGDNFLWDMDYDSEHQDDGEIYEEYYCCHYCGEKLDRDSVIKFFREV